jgi:hypothetical protein
MAKSAKSAKKAVKVKDMSPKKNPKGGLPAVQKASQ